MRGVFLGISVLIAVGAVGCLHGSDKAGSVESAERQPVGAEAPPTPYAGP